MTLALVVGGVRSGKSAVAERLAAATGAPVHYLATASGDDPEMVERIAIHRARRPATWRTVEGASAWALPSDLDASTVLVDGIGPWLTALLHVEGLWTDAEVAVLGASGRAAHQRALGRVRAFAEAAAARPGRTIVVAEESGLGVVPLGAGTRRYLDLAGDALQILAAHATRTLLVVAGRILDPQELAVAIADPGQRGATVQPWPPEVPSTATREVGADQPPDQGSLTPTAPSRPRQPPARCDEGSHREGGEGDEELRVHGDRLVEEGQLDFAVNVVGGEPPEWLREALSEGLASAGRYPDERPAERALAARHRRGPDEVVACNGSAEALWLLAMALRPVRAVAVHPAFTEAEVALRGAGHVVERAFREHGTFALDPGAVPAEADLVVVGNPNNPTGTLDDAGTLASLARPGRVLVVDEAFMELDPGEPQSLASRADLPGLVVLRSLTKTWGLAGVRAGYLLAPAPVAAALRAARQPWSVNALACAALEAWARHGDAGQLAKRVAAARAELAAALAALPGVRVWPSAANFLLLCVPDGPRARAALAAGGIAVRPASTFPGLGDDHLRVAVRDPGDNGRLVAALREALR